jgi:hypothetical protein
MQVNPEKFPKVNGVGAKAFVEYMVSPEVQRMIGEFGKDKFGEPIFYADAGKKAEQLAKDNGGHTGSQRHNPQKKKQRNTQCRAVCHAGR